ncbi:MAG: SUF system Fe-S cluster assembly regulator [Alphaproteobacteria bacterium]|nr:SUF system Fe-S cluster assembly regulator [Alphaproteobacteria bacterium]MCD8520049.1 SUF system Fe-S cluster assembly regulator [Alphaproteobacteria bacterium]MCD8526418.1 SUF system Fe-S cluster assembly regulator [Alphaproteobacteria bacterium]MCD8571574.1 SUF system Fe-S cluster assembly regulator [Alphaproteobacteria bacterium]
MLKISKLADYAVVVLSSMDEVERATAVGLSTATRLPEPTVAKVLKLLAKGKVVTATRGAQGGYVLARSLSRIAVADVIAAVDGPVSLTACVSGGKDDCGLAKSCSVHGRWDGVNIAIRTALESVSLADMTRTPFCTALKNKEEEAHERRF